MRKPIAILISVSLAACTDSGDVVTPPEPLAAALSPFTVSGVVTLPDGSNLCDALAPDAAYRVRLIRRVSGQDQLAASATRFCPSNAFTLLNVPSGSDYVLQVARLDGEFNTMPHSFFQPTPFAVTRDRTRNVRVGHGRLLRGSARVGNRRIEGQTLTLQPSLSDYFLSTIQLTSDENGAWQLDGAPAYLQRGLTYQARCSWPLGTNPTPPRVIDFPADGSAIDCAYEASGLSRWTHRATNLAFSTGTGMFGTYPDDWHGLGYGVQFPVSPGAEPSRDASASHLFHGGILLAVNDQVASTSYIFDPLECSRMACRNFSTANPPRVRREAGDGRRYTWELTEQTGSNIGMTITQATYDGEHGDYILMRITMKNTSPETVTVFAGLFLDWDVSGDDDNAGGTLRSGRVAYVTNPVTDIHMASAILTNHPTYATRLMTNVWPDLLSEADQLATLKGQQNATSVDPGNVSVIQSAGPINIRAGRSKSIWLVIAAGQGAAALDANISGAGQQFATLTGGASPF